ncbi:MAG: dioxygenase [Caulobacteraceae bacterium]|nr:dioxygenase [Caulobacteraceae bacterium]
MFPRRMPSVFISHGAGPCFFVANPLGGPGAWDGLRQSLEALPGQLPTRPKAILVVSAHWETFGFRASASERPPLVYDYSNYPPEAYAIEYPAAGAPALAERVCELLRARGLPAQPDPRGLDHSVFIPLKVMFPKGDVPVVALSLDVSLDPGLHFAAGETLAPLRDEGVLIVGSGSSFHGRNADPVAAASFDQWLETVLADPDRRRPRLIDWAKAPGARISHPREEHLLPLMVAVGAAASAPGRRLSRDDFRQMPISNFMFGGGDAG